MEIIYTISHLLNIELQKDTCREEDKTEVNCRFRKLLFPGQLQSHHQLQYHIAIALHHREQRTISRFCRNRCSFSQQSFYSGSFYDILFSSLFKTLFPSIASEFAGRSFFCFCLHTNPFTLQPYSKKVVEKNSTSFYDNLFSSFFKTLFPSIAFEFIGLSFFFPYSQ